MAGKRKILIQLDTDARPSAFDAVVAVDSGAEVLLRYSGVTPDNVRDLVYGAIFTRGPKDLKSTALFVGGSDVARGEEVLAAARKAFLGPLGVSSMLDSGGANTTAAGAVVAALKHLGAADAALPLARRRAVVLGSTGPVGRRVCRLLARVGAHVVMGSRSTERAAAVAEEIRAAVEGAVAEAALTGTARETRAALDGAELVVAAGGPGVCLLRAAERRELEDLRVAIDLNAVPPLGIEGIDVTAAGAELEGLTVYGAVGVGAIKMKIHKRCVASLFETNDRVLDAEDIFAVARSI